jgi:hypothetical protein
MKKTTSDKIEDAQRVYFFERSDGQVIACQENEAWSLYKHRQQVLGKNKRMDFKLIGTGDGNIFRESAIRAREAGRTDIKEAQRILKEGQEAELAACLGKIIPPHDTDKMGDPNAF